MFSGSYIHNMDAKGRLVLPAKLRSRIGSGVTVTKGLNRCLWLFPEEAWQDVLTRLTADAIGRSNLLALQRFFLGSAADAGPDDQGRISLPPLLREYAGIEREVVTVGMGDRLEIWSRERWDAVQAELTDERINALVDELNL